MARVGAGSCGAPRAFQTEKAPAVPARAGDRAGDGGERPIWSAFPLETVRQDGDRVLDAGVFAQEPRSSERPAVGADAAEDALCVRQVVAWIGSEPGGVGVGNWLDTDK